MDDPSTKTPKDYSKSRNTKHLWSSGPEPESPLPEHFLPWQFIMPRDIVKFKSVRFLFRLLTSKTICNLSYLLIIKRAAHAPRLRARQLLIGSTTPEIFGLAIYEDHGIH